jgi:hypothetical protein
VRAISPVMSMEGHWPPSFGPGLSGRPGFLTIALRFGFFGLIGRIIGISDPHAN